MAGTPRAYWAGMTRNERGVAAGVAILVGLLLALLLAGRLGPSYFLFLVGLGGMFALMSLGLNTQWGFTGLINFSVAAFFGLGAYGTALLTSSNSPLAGRLTAWVPALEAYPQVLPLLGILLALLLAGVVAVLIAVPTMRLRADYLAIATLGLAEIVRRVVRNERWLTAGTQGLRGIPFFFEGWPLLGTFPQAMPGLRIVVVPGSPIVLRTAFWRQLLNVSLVLGFLAVTYLVLRRAHRSPWGRVLRTIRSDEDLAKALGKDTFAFKMQAFVLGSLFVALAGVFFAHLQLFVHPDNLDPVTTFYVWVAVILGGSGSNRGALLGGFVIVTIREGSRFVGELGTVPVDAASLRLFAIGLLIVLLMRFRPEGILPPQRELIWPDALDERSEPTDGTVTDGEGSPDE